MKTIDKLDPTQKGSLSQSWRKKRFGFFLEKLEKVKKEGVCQILDVGGTEDYWESMEFHPDGTFHITLVNLEISPVRNAASFTSMKGDACDLSAFSDKQFDVVYSNSVIEHLYSKEAQRKMASEVRRVGRNYFVQTPNFYFPMEPHWVFPFFQFLPFYLRVALTYWFDLGHYKKAATWQEAKRRVNEVRLMTESEMCELFPDGKVYKEMLFGLKKSVSLYRFEA
jgi:hypothetical protein